MMCVYSTRLLIAAEARGRVKSKRLRDILIPAFFRSRVLDLKPRLDQLEASVRSLDAAVDALVVTPTYVRSDDVGFNGQMCRKRIFADVIAAIAVDAIVETGTWLGNTTGYMAETSQAPVYSCDLDPRFHAIAKMRLAQMEGIHLHLSDSRQFLRDLTDGALTDRSVFFYLDAHWTDDLPLLEELELIATHWRRFVVMVDDFKVPGDPGYGYDDYGSGRALVLETLEASLAKYELVAYFPAASSQEETGRRRGSILLAPRGDFSERLSHLKSLRQA
jgi:predicted O-methyltransferase YrrM